MLKLIVMILDKKNPAYEFSRILPKSSSIILHNSSSFWCNSIQKVQLHSGSFKKPFGYLHNNTPDTLFASLTISEKKKYFHVSNIIQFFQLNIDFAFRYAFDRVLEWNENT